MDKVNDFKLAVTAVVALLTSLWGWFGWLVVLFVGCMAVDYLTGTAAAMHRGEWSSKSARDGIFHKIGSVIVVMVAGAADLLIGAMLGYTVLASESPFEAAEEGVFIKAFAKTNKKGAPVVTLVVTNIIIELFLITWLFTDSTYQFFYTLSAGMILLPYLLSAAYFAKVAFKEPEAFKGHLSGPILWWRILGCVGVVYSLFLSWAAGVLGVILMCLLYVPGIVMYIWGKKERGEKYFQSTLDKVVLVVIIAAACLSIYLLVTTPGLV